MMSTGPIIQDLRVARGRVWNIDEVVRRFPVGDAAAPWNRGVKVSDEAWLDDFIYHGFRSHGLAFLNHLRGRFATAYFDPARRCLFLARDWIGELPFHLLATPRGVLIANTINAIRRAAADHYAYAYVRALPQGHVQELDLSEVDPDCVALTMRPMEPQLYCDFSALVHGFPGRNPAARVVVARMRYEVGAGTGQNRRSARPRAVRYSRSLATA